MKNNIEPNQLSVIDYLLIPLRHWILVLSLMAMTIALALWHNSQSVNFYQATTKLLIDKENVRYALTNQQRQYETYLSESLTFNSHYELITSQDVLRRVAQNLDLERSNERPVQVETPPTGRIHKYLYRFRENFPRSLSNFFQVTIPDYIGRIRKNVKLVFDRSKEEPAAPKSDSISAAVRVLKGIVRVEPVEDTRLLKIIVTHTDPVMSANIANGVADAYIQFNIDNRLQSSKDMLAWLTKSLDGIKRNLEKSEEEFLDYKESMNVISLEESGKRAAQEIQNLNTAYIEARNNRFELEAKLKELNSLLQSGADSPNMRFLASSPILESLHQELVKEEMALSKARGVYQKKHPKYIEIENRIIDIQTKLQEQLSREVDNLKAELTVVKAKEGVLQRSITELESEAMASNRSEMGYNILKRNVEMNQEVYDALLARIKEDDLRGNIDVSNIRVVEEAVVPTNPAGPNRKRNFFIAVILGQIIGMAGSFLVEFTDRSIRSEEDVENYLDIPLLSVIPKL